MASVSFTSRNEIRTGSLASLWRRPTTSWKSMDVSSSPPSMRLTWVSFQASTYAASLPMPNWPIGGRPLDGGPFFFDSATRQS